MLILHLDFDVLSVIASSCGARIRNTRVLNKLRLGSSTSKLTFIEVELHKKLECAMRGKEDRHSKLIMAQVFYSTLAAEETKEVFPSLEQTENKKKQAHMSS